MAMFTTGMLVMALAAPTAIVDSVHGTAALRPLQLLHPGQRIELGTQGRVRIAYFASCVHETIRGGRLWVGVTASLGGSDAVERVTADCLPPAYGAVPGGAPAALVLRSGDSVKVPPARRLRTRTPLVVAAPGERIRMVRERPAGRSLFFTVNDEPFNFADKRLMLEAGEVWRACGARRCVRVWVDPRDAHESGPVLERVIALR